VPPKRGEAGTTKPLPGRGDKRLPGERRAEGDSSEGNLGLGDGWALSMIKEIGRTKRVGMAQMSREGDWVAGMIGLWF